MKKLIEIYDEIQWIDESLLDEEYPTSWNPEEFANLRSFAARVRYCDEHLQKLRAGSARS